MRLNPALPPALDAWLATVLAIDPERRYPNMLVCAEALAQALGIASTAPRVAMPARPRRMSTSFKIGSLIAIAAAMTAIAWVRSGHIVERAAAAESPRFAQIDPLCPAREPREGAAHELTTPREPSADACRSAFTTSEASHPHVTEHAASKQPIPYRADPY